MILSGELRKMKSEYVDSHIKYDFVFFNREAKNIEKVNADSIIGKKINIVHSGKINCSNCGVKTKKTYMDGLCYKCFQSSPKASPCVLRPELCRAHLGEGRDVEWEEKNHNQPHIVYLAASDVVKVGVTRKTQIPTRWIDQGANMTVVLAETPNRFIAGQIEVALKQEFTDKTNWRKMLTNDIDNSIDLSEVKWELEELLPEDISQYITDDDDVFDFNYPVEQYPEKVKSLNLLKTPEFEGVLKGIKGQYLIFDNGFVFNVRKHTAFDVKLNIL